MARIIRLNNSLYIGITRQGEYYLGSQKLIPSGKQYFECYITNSNQAVQLALMDIDKGFSDLNYTIGDINTGCIVQMNKSAHDIGQISYIGNSFVRYNYENPISLKISAYATAVLIGYAIDYDNSIIDVYSDGNLINHNDFNQPEYSQFGGSIKSLNTIYCGGITIQAAGTFTFNFGENPFTYVAPKGYTSVYEYEPTVNCDLKIY